MQVLTHLGPRTERRLFDLRFSFWDRSELARLHRLLMPPGVWNIPRKKKWRYLLRVLREVYFPRKTGHGKRLGLLTHFGLLCKQKVSSFACREALSY